jgi:hypothetical protein
MMVCEITWDMKHQIETTREPGKNLSASSGIAQVSRKDLSRLPFLNIIDDCFLNPWVSDGCRPANIWPGIYAAEEVGFIQQKRETVPRSHPSRGITGDQRHPRFKQTKTFQFTAEPKSGVAHRSVSLMMMALTVVPPDVPQGRVTVSDKVKTTAFLNRKNIMVNGGVENTRTRRKSTFRGRLATTYKATAGVATGPLTIFYQENK